MQLIRTLQALLASRDESQRGATMVEYAFLITLIAIAVVVAAAALGAGLVPLYNSATSSL